MNLPNSKDLLRATEDETTWFHNLTPHSLPQPLPDSISLHHDGNRYGIRASGVCGTIRLRDGRTLWISPKIGRVNFLRMLFTIGGERLDNMQVQQDSASYRYELSYSTPPAMVADRLFKRADSLMCRSLGARRDRFVCRSGFIEGRLHLVETASRLLQRSDTPIVSSRDIRTYDTAENRLILASLEQASTFLRLEDRLYSDRVLARWHAVVPLSYDVIADLKVVRHGLVTGRYRGPRGYYEEVLRLATVILGVAGISYSESTDIHAEAALIRTSSVFERYITTCITRGHVPFGYVVTKPGSTGVTLYTDGSVSLRPDIVISRFGRSVVLGDAKYKVPDSSDHHQMFTYLNGFEVQDGVLIYPVREEGVVWKKRETTSGHRIVELGLPITDAVVVENLLENLVDALRGSTGRS